MESQCCEGRGGEGRGGEGRGGEGRGGERRGGEGRGGEGERKLKVRHAGEMEVEAGGIAAHHSPTHVRTHIHT